jgi:Domain of unknown function (DUF4118)
MLKHQPNPELMLDSKTHSKHLRYGRNCEIGVSHSRSTLCLSDAYLNASWKNVHPALDFSHSNPAFCHPNVSGNISIKHFREPWETRMQLSHWINTNWINTKWINKNSMKTAAEKLWTMPLMDAAIGGVVCSLAALGTIAAAEGHTWKNMVPLIFTAILVVIAALFGVKAGILSTVLAALFFATFLFGPTGSISVANESARSNLGWMLLIGIGFSFLFAPTSSGFRRH